MNLLRVPYRKIFLLTLLVAFLVMGSIPINRLAKMNIVVASPEEMIFVDPPSIVDPSLTSGTSFTVNINVSEVVDLYSWQIMIQWEPSILDFNDLTFGDFLADQPGGTLPNGPTIDQIQGYAGFGETSRGEIPGVDGSGWLATVEFLVEVDEGETVLDISGGDFQLTYYTKSTAPAIPVYPTIESGYFSNIAVTLYGSIGGVVTDSDTDLPIEGASVVADGYSDTSAADGSYLITDVPVGDYTVTASASGYVTQDEPATVTADTTTTVDFALVPTPETVMFVDPPTATANPGETFTINLNISDVEDLYSWGAKIKWQLGLLTVTNAEEGPFLKTSGSTVFVWTPYTGYVDLAVTFLGVVPGVSGSGGLASVTFEVLKAGNCTLDLYDTKPLNSSRVQISHQALDGYFYTTYPVAQFTYSPNPLDNPGHPIEGEPVTFDASASYDPDGGAISLYEWDFGDETTGLGQIIDHTYDTAGSYQVNLTVTDDEGETWTELLQILVLLHDISVEEIVVDPTEVAPGNPVEINATILNMGLVSETFNVTVYYDDTPIGTQTYMSLSPDENTTLTFTWDTSGVPPNEYTIKAYAYLVDATTLEARPDLETNMDDNTLVDGTVTITAAEIHDVAVTSVTAPAQAVQGDTVTIDVDVSNLGGFEETFNVEVTYDTTLIGSESVTLASGASTTVSFSWDTTGVALGTYTITAEAILATDEVPANNIDTTTIEITTVVTHDIAILDVVPSTLEAVIGDSVEIDVTITNEGTAEETFTVNVYAGDKLVDSTTQTLNAGAEEIFTLSWTTNVTGVFLIEAEVPAVPGETDTADNTLTDGEVIVIPKTIDHPVEVGGVTFDVTTESNSTISDFTFDQAEKQISFEVTGPEGTTGSCNVTIPKDLMGAPFTVLINGAELTYDMTEDATHYFLYFTYTHSAHTIQIEATTVATPPIASFTYSPSSPMVGETVNFDASASYDPDGTIASYAWDFGDATTGNGMTTSHAYTSADTYTVTLTVTDNDGLSDTTTQDITVTEVAAISASVNIDPDTLNLNSKGNMITCYIKLPEGYSVGDIDISTILLDGVISADRGETDETVLMVKFDRAEVTQYIVDVLHMTEGEITLTVTGNLADGTPFEGEDTIRVQAKGKGYTSMSITAEQDLLQMLAVVLWPLANALTRSRFK